MCWVLPFEGQCPKKHLQHHKLLITYENITWERVSNLLALPTHPKISKNEQVRKSLSSSQPLTRGRVTWKTTTRTRSPKTTPTGASTRGEGHSKPSRGSFQLTKSFMRYLVATMAETMGQERTRCPRSGTPPTHCCWLSPSQGAVERQKTLLFSPVVGLPW